MSGGTHGTQPGTSRARCHRCWHVLSTRVLVLSPGHLGQAGPPATQPCGARPAEPAGGSGSPGTGGERTQPGWLPHILALHGIGSQGTWVFLGIWGSWKHPVPVWRLLEAAPAPRLVPRMPGDVGEGAGTWQLEAVPVLASSQGLLSGLFSLAEGAGEGSGVPLCGRAAERAWQAAELPAGAGRGTAASRRSPSSQGGGRGAARGVLGSSLCSPRVPSC